MGEDDRNLRTAPRLRAKQEQSHEDARATTYTALAWSVRNGAPSSEGMFGGWPKGNFNADPNVDRNVPHVVPQMPTGAFINVTIAEPPRCTVDRYELYKKELLWRRDIHHGASDQQLIGLMALKAEGVIKAY